MNILRQDLILKLASEFNNASVPPPTYTACDTKRQDAQSLEVPLKAHLDFKPFNAAQ